MFSGIVTDNKFTNYLSLKTESEKNSPKDEKIIRKYIEMRYSSYYFHIFL